MDIEVNEVSVKCGEAQSSLLEVANTCRSGGIGESESGHEPGEVVLDHLLGDGGGQALAAVVLAEQGHSAADVLAAGDGVRGAGLSPLEAPLEALEEAEDFRLHSQAVHCQEEDQKALHNYVARYVRLIWTLLKAQAADSHRHGVKQCANAYLGCFFPSTPFKLGIKPFSHR